MSHRNRLFREGGLHGKHAVFPGRESGDRPSMIDNGFVWRRAIRAGSQFACQGRVPAVETFVRTHTTQGVTLVSTHSIDTEHQPATQSAVRVAANHKFNAFLAAMLGLVIVFGVGFAPSDVVHNAAHDGRHSLSVPCH